MYFGCDSDGLWRNKRPTDQQNDRIRPCVNASAAKYHVQEHQARLQGVRGASYTSPCALTTITYNVITPHGQRGHCNRRLANGPSVRLLLDSHFGFSLLIGFVLLSGPVAHKLY
ncbi:hypothetical protein ElyMa_001813600 [Elysia marginata]|uniref:Uncharacterized protein n=1 Tax=Elysia marginata TaxID=1093978 RepID=A0AAV4EIL1_9GAST|nr:hypothetical protein ElyMa_001813600 [Elysia marginata]